jgi:CheY-like chemotaxis protein
MDCQKHGISRFGRPGAPAPFVLYRNERWALIFAHEIMNNHPEFELPIEAEASEANGHALPSRPRRIMVVDDEPNARVLAYRVFSEAGFDVITVQSGFECLELFRKRPHWFDLILLDLSMPFMDGEETFKRLRALNPDVAVLLSTGFLSQAQDRIDRMRAAGLSGFIRKPHRPDELLARVQVVLDNAKFPRAGCAMNELGFL